MPENPNEILLSEVFSKKLKISPGDEVTFFGSTMEGSMVFESFVMSGTVMFGNPVLDRSTFIVDLKKTQMILDMENGSSELLAYFKTDFYDGRARANIAAFSYDYENLQFQATDPDPYRGGVANIPESEMSGVEIEFTGLISDSLTFDMNLAFLDSEVTSDYEVLDNVDAYQYFFGEEDLRYGLRENIRGNKLAKSPEFTADLSVVYETDLASGNSLTAIMQYVKRGEFEQRVSNNPIVDSIPAYDIFNITVGIDFMNSVSVDFMLLNATDEDGINSSMTDVFGVAGTGIELIPPRQLLGRLRYSF